MCKHSSKSVQVYLHWRCGRFDFMTPSAKTIWIIKPFGAAGWPTEIERFYGLVHVLLPFSLNELHEKCEYYLWYPLMNEKCNTKRPEQWTREREKSATICCERSKINSSSINSYVVYLLSFTPNHYYRITYIFRVCHSQSHGNAAQCNEMKVNNRLESCRWKCLETHFFLSISLSSIKKRAWNVRPIPLTEFGCRNCNEHLSV